MRTPSIPQNPSANNYDDYDETECIRRWITKDATLRKTAHIIAEFGGPDALTAWVCECFVPNPADTLANDLLIRATNRVDFRRLHDSLVP